MVYTGRPQPNESGTQRKIILLHRLVIAESASKVVFSLRLHFDVEGFSLPFYISVEPHAATLNAGIN